MTDKWYEITDPNIPASLIPVLRENGYKHARFIPGRGVCALLQMAFTTGLMVNINDTFYEFRYCYNDPMEAFLALALWDGKGDAPGNWNVRKGIGGDYRNPNKDTTTHPPESAAHKNSATNPTE